MIKQSSGGNNERDEDCDYDNDSVDDGVRYIEGEEDKNKRMVMKMR